ncbi:MAG: hypothetical protein JWQ86_2703, partial [Mycobacterium sp.]|nr:hypothetical protein [Mycobacterium sp.]
MIAGVGQRQTAVIERWPGCRYVPGRVQPVDLSAAEIAALLTILRLAHARVIGGPAGRPGLRVL